MVYGNDLLAQQLYPLLNKIGKQELIYCVTPCYATMLLCYYATMQPTKHKVSLVINTCAGRILPSFLIIILTHPVR